MGGFLKKPITETGKKTPVVRALNVHGRHASLSFIFIQTNGRIRHQINAYEKHLEAQTLEKQLTDHILAARESRQAGIEDSDVSISFFQSTGTVVSGCSAGGMHRRVHAGDKKVHRG